MTQTFVYWVYDVGETPLCPGFRVAAKNTLTVEYRRIVGRLISKVTFFKPTSMFLLMVLYYCFTTRDHNILINSR